MSISHVSIINKPRKSCLICIAAFTIAIVITIFNVAREVKYAADRLHQDSIKRAQVDIRNKSYKQ